MKKDSNSEIIQLKEALKNAEQSLAHWNALLPERESLEASIQEMLVHIDAATVAMHQQEKHNSELALQISNEIKQHKEFLSKANLKKQALDHLLDACEDYSEETIIVIKQKLIKAILEAHPDQQEVYAHFEVERNQIAALHAELYEISQVCANLGEMLKIVLDTRQKIKRQWVLGYLFGKNPNVVITQQLQNAATLCEAALAALEFHQTNALKDAVLKELHLEITGFLKELHKHCKQRWGFRTLDTTFAKLASTLAGLQETVDSHLATIEKARSTLDKKFNSWIDTYSSFK